MKFAFMIWGREGEAVLPDGNTYIVGVKDMEEAEKKARQLQGRGIDAIELCGAFKEEGTRRLIAATGGTLPVGYVVHLPEQDDLFDKVFG